MSPIEAEGQIRQAVRAAEQDDGPVEPSRPDGRARWWASRDWWLRTSASAAVGRIVGALLTGAGLLLAWLLARVLG